MPFDIDHFIQIIEREEVNRMLTEKNIDRSNRYIEDYELYEKEYARKATRSSRTDQSNVQGTA